MNKFKYLCCYNRTIDDAPPGTDTICPVCYWQDDYAQGVQPNMTGGPNRISLIEARKNYVIYGAFDKKYSNNVRKATDKEKTGFNFNTEYENTYLSSFEVKDINTPRLFLTILRYKMSIVMTTNTILQIQNYLSSNLYFILNTLTSKDIGRIGLFNHYNGRLIINQYLNPIILESDNRYFTNLNIITKQFLNKLYNCDTKAICLDISPQELQDIYYNPNNKNSYNIYYDKLKCFISVDNDFTFLKIFHREESFIDDFFKENPSLGEYYEIIM